MTPERRVKQKVVEVLKRLDCYFTMPVTGGYGNSGVPDFLICYEGRFIAIECKAGKNIPTALQLDHIKRINARGGHAWVVNEENISSLQYKLENLSND